MQRNAEASARPEMKMVEIWHETDRCYLDIELIMTVPQTLAVVLNPASGLQKAESRRYHVIARNEVIRKLQDCRRGRIYRFFSGLLRSSQ